MANLFYFESHLSINSQCFHLNMTKTLIAIHCPPAARVSNYNFHTCFLYPCFFGVSNRRVLLLENKWSPFSFITFIAFLYPSVCSLVTQLIILVLSLSRLCFNISSFFTCSYIHGSHTIKRFLFWYKRSKTEKKSGQKHKARLLMKAIKLFM